MGTSSARNIAAAALAACILGLATCPIPYIAIGALSGFPLAFSLVLLPPFLIGCGFLLWRFLARPAASTGGLPLRVAEIPSWLAVIGFLYFVSAFNLQTAAERIGLSSAFFLLTSLVCLPWLLLRETALEARIRRLPKAVAVGTLFGILAVTGTVAIRYLLSPPTFI